MHFSLHSTFLKGLCINIAIFFAIYFAFVRFEILIFSRIWDLSGRLVHSSSLMANYCDHVLDISSYSAGVYYLKVFCSDEFLYSGEFVKM
jgi:hypothetical protein